MEYSSLKRQGSWDKLRRMLWLQGAMAGRMDLLLTKLLGREQGGQLANPDSQYYHGMQKVSREALVHHGLHQSASHMFSVQEANHLQPASGVGL